MKRRAKGKKPLKVAAGSGMVRLQNPVSEHFASFVFGNAVEWEKMAHAELQRSAPEAIEKLAALAETVDTVEFSAAFREALYRHCPNRFVLEQDTAKGLTLAICGAGPSLRDHAAEYCAKADRVWGCNSALTWLLDNGHRVTHGFTIDQTAHMVGEWYSAPDVEYLVATTVHPHLTEYLVSKERRVAFFNNYVGIVGENVTHDDQTMSYEDWLYTLLFPGTVRAGAGLNSVTRAIEVAFFLGYEKVYVLGADCAMRCKTKAPDVPHGSPEHLRWLNEDVEMHADGGGALASQASATTLGGEIDGRHWETKVDMAISAVFLVQMKKLYGDKLELVGDTLPNAIMDKSDEFIDRLPALVDSQGKAIRLVAA